MTSNEILRADVLDILFDNRNKQYGAYTLRKNYAYHLTIALCMTLSSVLLLFFLSPGNRSSNDINKMDGDVFIKTFQIPKEIKRLPPPQFRQKKSFHIRQRILTTPIIVNKNIVAPPPHIRELETSLISNKKTAGFLDKGFPVISERATVQKKELEQKLVAVKSDQREPEFPGGQEAWINFLRKNLIVPGELDAGEKKMVQIRFVVSTDGSITDFEIMQSAGKDFDNEVIRVLKKMPKWKPAVENGRPVIRSYTQPVTFIGVEE